MIDSTATPRSRDSKQRGRSRRCSRHRRPGGHAARRPRHSLHRRLLHSRRSPSRATRQRAAPGHRCRGRHALRRPGDHGHPERSALPRRRPKAALASLPPAAGPSPAFTSAAAGCRTRSSGLIGIFASASPGARTPSSCSTRPRSSAGARVRRRSALRREMPPPTATAARTRERLGRPSWWLSEIAGGQAEQPVATRTRRFASVRAPRRMPQKKRESPMWREGVESTI